MNQPIIPKFLILFSRLSSTSTLTLDAFSSVATVTGRYLIRLMYIPVGYIPSIEMITPPCPNIWSCSVQRGRHQVHQINVFNLMIFPFPSSLSHGCILIALFVPVNVL
ncbi:hypothetical protein WG66_015279 [Moniliophthora roreri]|nr:hypothetical protein WG66_015279 [Moniliophthora roreri]